MTNFNPDPRVRDKEPNTTGLGPNFPGSVQDLWRMVFRPSPDFLRYVLMAVCNDDGTALAAKTESKLDEVIAELKLLNAQFKTLLETE